MPRKLSNDETSIVNRVHRYQKFNYNAFDSATTIIQQYDDESLNSFEVDTLTESKNHMTEIMNDWFNEFLDKMSNMRDRIAQLEQIISDKHYYNKPYHKEEAELERLQDKLDDLESTERDIDDIGSRLHHTRF